MDKVAQLVELYIFIFHKMYIYIVSFTNIAFYYLVEVCEGYDIPDIGEFVSQKDNCDVVIGWISIEQLQDVIIYPEFLKKEIYRLDEEMKHFVSRG